MGSELRSSLAQPQTQGLQPGVALNGHREMVAPLGAPQWEPEEEAAPPGRALRGSSASLLHPAWKCPDPQLPRASNPCSCCFCYPEGFTFKRAGSIRACVSWCIGSC